MPLICAEIHSCLQTTEKLPHPPKKFSATPFFHSYIFSTTSLVWRLLNSSFALSQRTLASNSWDLMYMFVFNIIFALFYRSQRAAGQWHKVLAYLWSSLFAPWLLPHLGFGPMIPLSQGLFYHQHCCHRHHHHYHHHHHPPMASTTPWLLPVDSTSVEPRLVLSSISLSSSSSLLPSSS